MPQFILASTSKYRAQILKDFGIKFSQVSPDVDEDSLKLKYKTLSPKELCDQLARDKAQSIASKNPESVVIGSDQLVQFNGQILGKPLSVDTNITQLKLLSGKTHELITALCVCYKDKVEQATVIASLTLRELTLNQIKAYVENDQALDCAGGYKIEKQGIALMSTIETKDFTSIKGLPLLALTDCLLKLGIDVLENKS